MEILCTFLVCSLVFVSFSAWVLWTKWKESEANAHELSNALHNNQLQGTVEVDEYSRGYNKGVSDSERLYKANISFVQEHYGNILAQMESQVQVVHRTQMESPTIQYLDDLVNRPTQAEKKPVQLSPVLLGGEGTQDISDSLGKFG